MTFAENVNLLATRVAEEFQAAYEAIDDIVIVSSTEPTGVPDDTIWIDQSEDGPGRTVRNGAGAPDSGLGVDGDFYIDTAAHTIYGPKTAGAWGSSTSLVGPTGSTGSTGSTGAGVPTGGATGKTLVKASGTNYDTAWGDLSADNIAEGTTTKILTATERTKLAGVATGATANDTDANLKARANHTGTQTASTISDFSTAADARVAAAVGVTVQPLDSDLTAFAAKTAPSGAVVGTTDSQTLTNKTLTTPAISSPTGLVKGDVGLGNVDNTADTAKPVSTAQQTALNLKAQALVFSHVLFHGGGNNLVYTVTPLTAGTTEPSNVPLTRDLADLANATQMRIVVGQRIIGAGGTSCEGRIQYSTNGATQTAWADANNTGTGLDLRTGTANTLRTTGWVDLVAGAKADATYLRFVHVIVGTVTTAPTINKIEVQFR